MHSRNHDAVSEVVGILLVLTMASSLISVTLFWAGDRLESEKTSHSGASAVTQFGGINSALQENIRQGIGSSKVANFVTDKGYVHLSSRGTRIVVYCSLQPQFWFDVTGFEDENDKTFTIHVKNMSNNPLLQYNKDLILHHLTIKNLKDDTAIQIDNNPIDECTPNLPFTFQLNADTPHKPFTIAQSFKIIAPYDLCDSIEISIDNTTACIGKILVFDVGYLAHELVSGGGTRLVTIENGGVISATSSGGYFTEEPRAVFHKDNLLRFFFNIIQLKPNEETSAGPGGSYKFIIKYDTFKSLLNDDDIYHFKQWGEFYNENYGFWYWSLTDIDHRALLGSNVNFKVQIVGEYADVWRNFFCSDHYYPDQECFGQYLKQGQFDQNLTYIGSDDRDAFYGTLFYKLTGTFYASIGLYVCGINMEVI